MSHLRSSEIIGTIASPFYDICGAPIKTNDIICRVLEERPPVDEEPVYNYYTEENMKKFLHVIESRKKPGDPDFYKESNEIKPGAYKWGYAILYDVDNALDAFEWMTPFYRTTMPLDELDTFIVKLLNRRIDYTVRNDEGQTLLIAASIKGLYRTVSTIINSSIINSSININAQDDYGDTALLCACKNNNAPIVKLLLVAGANSSIKNKDGKTCVDSIPGTLEEGRDVRTLVTQYAQRAGYKKRRRTNVRKNNRKNTRKARY